MDQPFVSVIIPTYNREESLLRTLDSLSQQTYPTERFEVIIVDDGSPRPLDRARFPHYPFALLVERQPNQGEVAARNWGVSHAHGELLVFLDDDITVAPVYLQVVVEGHLVEPQSIILGNILPIVSENPTPLKKYLGKAIATSLIDSNGLLQVSYIDCLSGIASIDRCGFLEIGQMRPLTSDGRNAWGGIDLAYRASRYGYRFFRASSAVAYHHDASISSLTSYCLRMHKLSRSAHILFQKYPDIEGQIPMFSDKGIIRWNKDSPSLILRKLARQVISSPPILRVMETLVPVLEERCPSAVVQERLYSWVSSAYIYRGYREGLLESNQRPAHDV